MKRFECKIVKFYYGNVAIDVWKRDFSNKTIAMFITNLFANLFDWFVIDKIWGIEKIVYDRKIGKRVM